MSSDEKLSRSMRVPVIASPSPLRKRSRSMSLRRCSRRSRTCRSGSRKSTRTAAKTSRMPAPAAVSTPLVLIHGDDDFAVKQRARQLYQQWSTELGGMDHEIIDAQVDRKSVV